MSKQGSLAVARTKQKAEKLLRNNHLPAALAEYQKFAQLMPRDPSVWLNLGAVAGRLNNFQEAQRAFMQAVALQPEMPQAHFNLARLAALRGAWQQAEQHYRSYLQLRPDDLDIHLQLGVALEAQGKLHEAEKNYSALQRLQSSNASLMLAHGRVLRLLGRGEEARQTIEQALQLQDNLADGYLEKGHLLRLEGDIAAAQDCYRRFYQLAPSERDTYLLSSAALLVEQQSYEVALSLFDEAVTAFPQSVNAHWSRAQVLMNLGRYSEGWSEFEWRMGYSEWRQQMREYAALQPLWRGEPLAGKTLLVYTEQGYGDTIQFCRFLEKLTDQGAHIVLHCQRPLMSLLGQLSGIEFIDELQPEKVATIEFDYCLPLMSLGQRLAIEVDKLPGEMPYLSPDRERQDYWRERLAASGKFKVGLVWAGSGSNPNDRRRSMRLADFAPLAEVSGVTWYSLQVGDQGYQMLAPDNALPLIDLSDELTDFAETAAVIANLDLVISVDTACAHLAGAIGQPVWTLVYAGHDWRWLAESETTPWYPTMRLFHQRGGESWAAVMARVTAALASQLEQHPRA